MLTNANILRFFFRENENYFMSVGRSIVEVSKVVPDGILVFFPSYEFMEDCKKCWQNDGTWKQIEEQKPVCLETKTKDSFNIENRKFSANINEQKGAIFMAVLRAKISEGIDFADMYGRAVLIIGLPLAPYDDPKIKLKRKYLDENRTVENQMHSGEEWYNLLAVRAVNQAIGRVIRHKNDYGAILLFDFRFNLQHNQRGISPWIQGHLSRQKTYKFDGIMQELSFYLSVCLCSDIV